MKAILDRRSIRKYTDEPVSDTDAKALLEAAFAAPSAGNQRPWHFVVIRDRNKLEEIPSFHPYSRMVPHSQLTIMVCADTHDLKYSHHWPHDCAAATQNILLEATDRGLGSCWLGVYPNEERMSGCRRLVGLPEGVVPFSLIPIGHPAEAKPSHSGVDESRMHNDMW